MDSTRRALAALLLPVLAACATPLPRAASVTLTAERGAPFDPLFVGSLVLVPAAIDGQPAGRFLLDTGSDVSAVDRRLLERIPLAPESSALVHGSGGAISASLVRGRVLEVGPIRVTSPVLLVLDLAPLEEALGVPLSGIIGLDCLEGMALTIDYPAGTVGAKPGGGEPSAGAERIPLRRREALVGIDVAIGDRAAEPMLLDTGMTSALALAVDEEELTSLGMGSPRWLEQRVGIGGTNRTSVTSLPSIRIGRFEIPNVEASIGHPGAGFTGAVGGRLLRRFRMTLDLKADVVELADGAARRVEP